jgi:hypothetical protein
MSAFELQTYKGGKWEIDSYYDDRELALSEAERLDVGGRHGGVRVVEENYDEATNRSTYNVVFSKMKRIAGGTDDWRTKAKRAPRTSRRSGAAGAAPGGEMHPRSRPRPAPKRNANLYIIIVLAAVLLFGGIAAMIGLQEVAKIM